MLLAKLDIKNKLVLIFQEGMNKKKQVQKNCFFTSPVTTYIMHTSTFYSDCIFGRTFVAKANFLAVLQSFRYLQIMEGYQYKQSCAETKKKHVDLHNTKILLQHDRSEQTAAATFTP